MVGEGPTGQGLMGMAVGEILGRVKMTEKWQSVGLKVSYLEVYRERIKDLLVTDGKNVPYLQIETCRFERIPNPV
jgi:hypothetical protein